MPFLQIVNGKYRVRIVVPPELRPYLPPPHTGKANLTRALGTGNEREANRLAVPWIADFQAAVTSAASVTQYPHGYDWITRYRAYHRGQNRFPPEGRLFPPHPALALPETQTRPHRKHRSRDQRLKSKVSTRKLALHGALLDEGFLDYRRPLPLGGPLFPNVPFDTTASEPVR